MAWSARSRAAALAARRRKHHGSATKHIGAKYVPKAKKVAKHVISKRKTVAQYAVAAAISPSTVRAKASSKARIAAKKGVKRVVKKHKKAVHGKRVS